MTTLEAQSDHANRSGHAAKHPRQQELEAMINTGGAGTLYCFATN